jgi:hypothetical protein
MEICRAGLCESMPPVITNLQFEKPRTKENANFGKEFVMPLIGR